MNNKFRNIFMAFGIIAILIMLCTMNMDYTDIWHYLLKVGIYFPLILALWLVVYLVNTLSWYLIINDEGRCEGLSFWRVYKLTVSGFALNYTTPCGLMGGEPYRIMELKPYTGVSKATSSVILYVMMHIFSHFWFWFLSIFLFIAFNPVGLSMGILLAVIGGFCLLGIYFFSR
ncbi:lysylphosphatidylglycerol synthase domain-containing protein, partial [Prevotella sp.]|uniref:lysylphosphatidylglycerol synthase domain-containing protein n=1 Tax=Prevotella sp. TaxID=59823 RepID=UPI00307CC522